MDGLAKGGKSFYSRGGSDGEENWVERLLDSSLSIRLEWLLIGGQLPDEAAATESKATERAAA
jgi:hypothetical protein